MENVRSAIRRLWDRLRRRDQPRYTFTSGEPDEWPLPSDSEPLPPGAYMHPNALREHAQRSIDRATLERRAREGRIEG
jgi:hypothetical protein